LRARLDEARGQLAELQPSLDDLDDLALVQSAMRNTRSTRRKLKKEQSRLEGAGRSKESAMKPLKETIRNLQNALRDAEELEDMRVRAHRLASGTMTPTSANVWRMKSLGERAMPHNCIVRATYSGWSNSCTWNELLQHFGNWGIGYRTRLKLAPNAQLILFVDGHRTHFNEEALRIAKKFNIKIVVFPPNLSHIIQPLDVAVFRTFK